MAVAVDKLSAGVPFLPFVQCSAFHQVQLFQYFCQLFYIVYGRMLLVPDDFFLAPYATIIISRQPSITSINVN